MATGTNLFVKGLRSELPLALVLLTAFPQILSAQEGGAAEKTATGTPKAEAVERIQVTGSRIKRSAVETSSPVTVVDRKQIERSGAATLGDVLRAESSSTTGNFAGSSGYVRAGSQTAGLFGLGAGRTLVLLDGERLPKDASLSGTNLNLIPASMIDRIEILSGGRSAVYGSDAIAGVVNVITRKNLVGNEVETYFRGSEDGGGTRIGLTASSGFQLGATNVIIGGGYDKTDRIYEKNRDFGQGQGKFANAQYAKPVGTFDYRIVGPTGAPIAGNLWTPSPNCPTENYGNLDGPGQAPRGTFCVGEAKEKNWDEVMPRTEGGFFSTRVTSEVGENTVNAFASYTQNASRGNAGNYFSNYNYYTARRQIISAAAFNDLGLGLTVPDGQAIETYAIDEYAADRINYNKDQSYGGFLSLDRSLGNSWEAQVSLTHYTTEARRDVDNVIDKIPYTAALHGSTSPAYITVDPNRDPNAYKNFVNRMSSSEKNGMTAAGMTFSSEVAELPAGSLGVAFGIDNRIETYQQTPDGLDTEFFQSQPRFTGTESVSGRGDRNVTSAFAELNIPVVTGVEVDTAVRYDNYSDFGDTTNYNYGVKYQPVSGLTLRHSAGTSFHAPELNYVHANGGGGYQTIRDEGYARYRESIGNPCTVENCNQIFVDRPGNEDLEPETARSYTIGFLVEPTDNFFFSADYIAYTLTNTFDLKDIQDIADDYYAGRGNGRTVVTPTGEGDLSYISTVARPWENIGRETQHLVKGEAQVKVPVSGVTYTYNTQNVRVISDREQQADGSMKQFAGIEGNPKWRWQNTVSAEWSDYEVSLLSDTTSRQAPDPENADTYLPTYFNDQVDEFTMYSASAGWDYSRTGSLTVGAQNLANKIGGLYRTGNFSGAETGNSFLYSRSYYGRSYFANVTQKF